MSTFLELVQELHREVGAAGSAPSAVTSQTGEARRLVGWVKKANFDVQDMWANWKFLRSTDERTLTPTDNTLAAPSDFNSGMWDLDTFKIIRAGDTLEEPLLGLEYEDVKTEDLDTSPGTPWRAVVMPDGSLRFEGTPDTADTFKADYYRGPDIEELAGNADESTIPARFHPIIIAKAMLYYANFEGAPEIKTQGLELWEDYLARLENNQLPNRKHARYRTGATIQIVAE